MRSKTLEGEDGKEGKESVLRNHWSTREKGGGKGRVGGEGVKGREERGGERVRGRRE